MEPIVGKILRDRYRLIQELSLDDFSKVYVAVDLAQGNAPQCRIEMLQPLYESEILGTQSWQKVLQKFVEQGHLLQQISQHPQIPRLLAFFESDREFYLVHELIPGKSLDKKLAHSVIDEGEAIEWLRGILTILESVHQAGVAHLNIQPSSLVQHQDGRMFLDDFAGIKNSILFANKSPKIIANKDFSPTEQKLGKPDFTTDIYALGKTIIYALTGNISEFIQAKSSRSNDAHESSTADNLAIDNINNLSLTKISRANIRPELAAILNKMVRENPSERFQSATEVLTELNFEQQNMIAFPPPFLSNQQSFPSSGKSPPKSSSSGLSSRSQNRNQRSARIRRSKLSQGIVWFLVTLPFIVALAIVFIGLNKNAYKGFIAYTNNDYQFEIQHPKNWSRRDLDDPITGEIVAFASPLETETDLYLEKVSITVEYLPSPTTTLEEYSAKVFERIEQEKSNNIEVYQERKTKIGDSAARMIVYSRQERGLNLRQLEVFTIKNNQVYIAIYTAERAKFSKFLATAEKIIDSWKIQ